MRWYNQDFQIIKALSNKVGSDRFNPASSKRSFSPHIVIMNCSQNESIGSSNQDFTIPTLPNRFLLIARIVITCSGLLTNLVVLMIYSQCRRLHYPRHTCWMAVTVAALLVHLLALIEMVSGAYPTWAGYVFLVFFKGSPFVFFSISYSLVAFERFLAVSYYMWHKENVTNRVVVMTFVGVGVFILIGLIMTNCFGSKTFYFMPGTTDISTWKVLLLAATVIISSLIGMILQVLTYRQVKQVYKTHPVLRRTDRRLFHIRYNQQQHSFVNKTNQSVIDLSDVTLNGELNQSKKKEKIQRASRLDLEACFYYFVISIPVLVSNGLMGLILAFNYICSHTQLASDCHRWVVISLYVRTIQLLIVACNPFAYFALSSEFRSAFRSKFAISSPTFRFNNNE